MKDEAAEQGAVVEVSPGEPQGTGEKLIQKTPWWAISIGLHALAALILGFLIVVQQPAESDEIVVMRKPRPKPEVPDMTTADVKAPVPIDVQTTATDPMLTLERDDHNETPDEEDFQKAKGDPDFVSDKPFRGKGAGDVIGGGGGGGGRKGTPFGGRVSKKAGGRGAPKVAEDAVLAALMWLARHQSPDGGWGVQGYVGQCGKIRSGRCTPNPDSASADFDTGVTGLALLAFLGAGYSHLSKDIHEGICFGDVVRKGLQWLMARQEPDGFVGPHTGHKEMYNHAICALALAEAYGLTGSTLFKENAQKAIDYLVSAQNPGKGWRYSARCGDNDSSVTGWAVMALKSAELSGLSFPGTAYAGCRAWLDEATDEGYARVGYTFRGTGKVFCPHNQHFDHQEALTAIGVMARAFMDKNPNDPKMKNGAALLMRDLPAYEGTKIDFYAWYYEALALYQVDGPKGPQWTRWSQSMLDALVKPQNTASSGCKGGSWEPVDRWSCEGGRAYATAINCLTLEVYYRYGNVFTGKDR